MQQNRSLRLPFLSPSSRGDSPVTPHFPADIRKLELSGRGSDSARRRDDKSTTSGRRFTRIVCLFGGKSPRTSGMGVPSGRGGEVGGGVLVGCKGNMRGARARGTRWRLDLGERRALGNLKPDQVFNPCTCRRLVMSFRGDSAKKWPRDPSGYDIRNGSKVGVDTRRR